MRLGPATFYQPRRASCSGDEDVPGETGDLVERLMGKKPEMRFAYIQQNAQFVEELDV